MRQQRPERRAQTREYSRKIRAYKLANPWCAACHELRLYCPSPHVKPNPTTDVHHKMGKEGDLLLDERYWMPTCRWCHDWIEDHGKLARQLGFVLDKNYREPL